MLKQRSRFVRLLIPPSPNQRDDAIANRAGFGLARSFEVDWSGLLLEHVVLRSGVDVQPLQAPKQVVDKPKLCYVRMDGMVRMTHELTNGAKYCKEALDDWDDLKLTLHVCMDEALSNVVDTHQAYLHNGCFTKFWEAWSEAVEKSFSIPHTIIGVEYDGHGCFRTKASVPHNPVVDCVSATLQPATQHLQTTRLVKQHRRFEQVLALIALIIGKHEDEACSTKRDATWHVSLARHVAAAIVCVSNEVEFERDVFKRQDSIHGLKLATSFRLRILSNPYNRNFVSGNDAYVEGLRKLRKQNLMEQPIGKRTFQVISGITGAALTVFEHTTIVFEIDDILRSVWSGVYAGNS